MKQTTALLLFLAAFTFAAACNNAPATNQSAGANTRAAATATPAAAATAAAPADEFQAARDTYAQFCIRCHRPDGSGGPFEIDGGKKLDVPSLREGHALKHTDEDFAEQIMNGGDGMPAFKNRLDPERINGLVRFIRHEFQSKTAPAANKPMPAPAH
jgi:mono/diheme cytochrome c family protein